MIYSQVNQFCSVYQGVSMLIGESGAGKTFLALLESVSAATGKRLSHSVLPPGKVVFLTSTADFNIVHGRIESICVHNAIPLDEVNPRLQVRADTLPLLVVNGDGAVVPDENAINTLISRCMNFHCALLYMDTLSAFHSLDERNPYHASMLGRILGRIAYSAGTSIIVTHTEKYGVPRGSSALLDAIPIIRKIEKVEDRPELRVSFLKNNFVPVDGRADKYQIVSAGLDPYTCGALVPVLGVNNSGGAAVSGGRSVPAPVIPKDEPKEMVPEPEEIEIDDTEPEPEEIEDEVAVALADHRAKLSELAKNTIVDLVTPDTSKTVHQLATSMKAAPTERGTLDERKQAIEDTIEPGFTENGLVYFIGKTKGKTNRVQCSVAPEDA